MQKLKLDRQVIISFSLIFFLIAELFILLPWQIKKTLVLNREITATVFKLKNIEKDWPNKDNYLNEQKQLKENIQKLQAKSIPPQEESKLFSFISTSSKNFEVEIKSLSPAKLKSQVSEEPGEFQYLPININARAKFHDLAGFLDYLQTSQYFLEIKDLNISSDYPDNNSITMLIWGLIKEK